MNQNNVIHAANDSSTSSIIQDNESISFSGEFIFPTASAPPTFPALYVVIAEELKVYKEPLTNDFQRSLKMVKFPHFTEV
jgi:hypothetical protein